MMEATPLYELMLKLTLEIVSAMLGPIISYKFFQKTLIK